MGRVNVRWRERFSRRLLASDFLVLTVVVYGTQFAWLGVSTADVAVRDDGALSEISYTLFSAGIIGAWVWALSLVDSRSHRVVGAGITEYVRVIDASMRLFGLVAILAFLTRIDVARGYLLIALPLGVLLLVLERWLWRRSLRAHRSRGDYTATVLLIGSEQSVARTAAELHLSPGAGYRVVGACVPGGVLGDIIPGTGIPVVGSTHAVELALMATEADTIAITSPDEVSADKVKHLSYNLESGQRHLVMSLNVVDIAGPRTLTRPVIGLPLVHIETPQFTHGQRVLKRVFDVACASFLLVALSPLLALLAFVVRTSSAGPALYRQQRIGMHGKPFTMLKFRSMREDADAELLQLLQSQGTHDTPLFKVDNDPRVTPVGRFIRKHSLDELPQLLNVIQGSMSMVGPRPQVAAEVALYSSAARRRLMAKPGVTGLWQVSGRSTLRWDEAVKLDLYYVENWSLFGDVAITLKTLKEVFAPGGSAY